MKHVWLTDLRLADRWTLSRQSVTLLIGGWFAGRELSFFSKMLSSSKYSLPDSLSAKPKQLWLFNVIVLNKTLSNLCEF